MRNANPGEAGGLWTEAEEQIIRDAISGKLNGHEDIADARWSGWISGMMVKKQIAKLAHQHLPARSESAIYMHMMMMGTRILPEHLQPPKPHSLPVIERTGAIVAWRIWRALYNGRDAILRSIATGWPWPAGEPLKAHRIEQWQTDETSSKTGIHAYKEPVTKEEYGYAVSGDYQGEKMVHGTLLLWGRVIEHENGYRAEFAYPDTIFAEDQQLAQAIARSYGIEAGVAFQSAQRG